MSVFDQTMSRLACKLAFMRYFFDLQDGACIRDPKGEEFADDAAALCEAAIVALELSKLPVHAHEWCVVVKNANGLTIGSVPLMPGRAPQAEGISVSPRLIH